MNNTLSSGNKIAKNTIFLYFRMLLIMFVSLYTVRAVLSVLGVVDYGIYNAIGGVVTSMTFLTLVLDNASQRFFALELSKGDNNRLATYFNSLLIVYLGLSFLIIIIIEVAGLWMIDHKMTIPPERIHSAYWVLHLSLASFIITIITNPFRALLMANERMDVYAYISIFDALAKLLIVFLLVNSPLDKLISYAVLVLTVSFISNALYIFFSRRKIKVTFAFILNGKIFHEILKYSSWTLFGTISGVASIQGANIVLNMFLGPVANTAFSIGTQVSNTIQQFSSSFFSAVRPPLTKSYGAGEYQYMNKLFSFSNKTIFALTFTIVFPLMANTEFILKLWLGEIAPYMIDFVRIMLVYALILSLNNPITTIVQAAGAVKQYHSVVDGFSLLVLPLLYVGLKIGIQPKYCMLSLIVVFSIAHFLRLIILKRVINYSIMKYIKEIVIPALIVVIACTILFWKLSSLFDGSVFSSMILLGICLLLPIVLSAFIVFAKEDRQRLYNMVKKKSNN